MSGLQVLLQQYNAWGVKPDGSCWSHRQYRLSDGTWWSIGYWHPPDLSYKPELEIGEF